MCPDCRRQLETDLRSTAWLVEQLELVVTGQVKGGSASVGFISNSSTWRLPVNLGASDAATALRDTLASWVRDLWETYAIRHQRCDGCRATWFAGDKTHAIADCPGSWGVVIDRLDVAPHPVTLAAWILRHPTWVQAHPAASELYDELTTVYRLAGRIVDRSPGREYLGNCPAAVDETGLMMDQDAEEYAGAVCRAQLYTPPGRASLRCRACSAVWTVAELRPYFLAELRAKKATAAQIAVAAGTVAGGILSAKTIRTWAARGKIETKGYDKESGAPLHLIGEVVDYAATRRNPLLAMTG